MGYSTWDDEDELADGLWALGGMAQRQGEVTHVRREIQARIQWRSLEVTSSMLTRLPLGRGIYVIEVGGQPWYVGKAPSGLRSRFQSRMRTFREFGVPSRTTYALLRRVRVHAGEMRTTGSEAFAVVEAHLVHALGTLGRGNRQIDGVRYYPNPRTGTKYRVRVQSLNTPRVLAAALPATLTLKDDMAGRRV